MAPAWISRVRRRPVRVVNAALGVLLAMCAWLGYATVSGSPVLAAAFGPAFSAAAAAQTASTGRIIAVSQGAVVDTVSATGTVGSTSTAGATFGTAGTVTEIDVAVGDPVRKGQVLAKVDASAASDQLAVAKANLAAATANLTAAESAGTTDPTAITSAQAQVTNAQKSVDSAQAALDSTVLTSPIDGTVTAVNGVVGSPSTGGSSAASGAAASGAAASGAAASGAAASGAAASASASAAPGSSSGGSGSSGFIEIADLTKLDVDASFAEADATKLKTGQAATIVWTALTGAQATGTVGTVAPEATTQNNVNTYAVTVNLDSVPQGARIGQTTTVAVTVAQAANAIRVPAGALHGTAAHHTVEVVDARGKRQTRAVQVGVQGNPWVEITSGLQVGEQVAVTATPVASTGGAGGAGTSAPLRGGPPSGD
jgi:macrolide-specific efflux system membrane fusion protein